MLRERLGQRSTYIIAMDSGYFDEIGKSKYQSVFESNFEDLNYLLSMKILKG